MDGGLRQTRCENILPGILGAVLAERERRWSEERERTTYTIVCTVYPCRNIWQVSNVAHTVVAYHYIELLQCVD